MNVRVVVICPQVRGSVPVFWSQPGYKYRPPPRLDKDATETAAAFSKHFEEEARRHSHVTCVSLVEQSGKEKVIADAFLNNILTLDSPSLTLITFDFHEYCRGMRYENVSVLIEGIEEQITKMLYCWVDKEGTICRQNGVFRINCIDCLDRTNVVQTAIAKCVLESQFVKLGMIPPEQPLPQACRSTLQVMWANNGDTVSKQYAGTSALKGDFTRTGERRFAGMMKDGMNSANRYYRNHFIDTYRQVAIDVMLGLELSNSQWQEIDYVETLLSVAGALMPIGPPSYMAEIAPANEKYLASALYSLSRYYMNRFKDAYRQATIDHLLGNPVTEDIMNLEASGEEEESSMTPEHVKHVIDDCKKLLVPDAETILGAWGLIDADPSTGDPDQIDMDIILVLTRDSYYVAQYDEEADQILHYERVSLIDLEKIEMGPFTCQAMFKQSRPHQCIRFNYMVEGQSGYLHMLRSMNIRFFNNMAITIKSDEETVESVKAIGETFEVACQMIGCDVLLVTGKMEKKRSRRRNQLANFLNPLASLTKTSLTSPDTLKTAGSRAFTNVTSGLARLNPMSNLRPKRPTSVTCHQASAKFYLQKPSVCVTDGGQEELVSLGGRETHLASCGVLASSLIPTAYPPRYLSPPLVRCHSDSALLRSNPGEQFPSSPSPNPEILVSGTVEASHTPSITPTFAGLSPTLLMQRVRKISHSSDEVDARDEREGGVARASSATDLQLHLPSSHSEGHIGGPSGIGSAGGELTSLVSPLSSLNKEAVLAPFSVLARGMQSLAPGAGRLARGMQSIGVNLDPRRLRAQRQRQLEEDPVMKEKKLQCKTKIIQL
ncbi:Phosphatidylinositide phosphatase SAC2 [Chionoecetes opilio]|uniref:Phosphatidylinositide phosphatase SAC2 n=1 Tax=Chionoecetes opilio TaxID=41210 RepID=A0A8J5CL97_CHIOP|nr:Phosphatidylinositide phosphatase SAC2 [Chionoecetes opilio]